jgi:hypothetical protein
VISVYVWQGLLLFLRYLLFDSVILFCFFTFYKVRIGFMVFNATFNNIAVISWRSVLLVEETGVPGENHRPVVRYNFNRRLRQA